MLHLTNDPSASCKGCISIDNYCPADGECSTCRAAIKEMHDTLWKIIQRARFPGDLDIRIMAAAALGLSLSDLEERGISTS